VPFGNSLKKDLSGSFLLTVKLGVWTPPARKPTLMATIYTENYTVSSFLSVEAVLRFSPKGKPKIR
jgi:hypothetical protein